MDEDSVIQYIVDTFAGVDVVRPVDGVGSGDTFFIYDPDRNLDVKHRFPFATMVTKDYGDFDRSSNLNRPGVFRLNIGVSRHTFTSLVGASGGVEPTYDFAALDQMLPHPVYAPQSWVCVLNPSPQTFQTLRPLLAEAYERARTRHPRKGSPEKEP